MLSIFSCAPLFKIKRKSTGFICWMQLKLTLKKEAAYAEKRLFKNQSNVICFSFCRTLTFTISLYCVSI